MCHKGISQNMPVLWQSALYQYSTELAKKAWVWYAETRGNGAQYAADAYANEVEKLVLVCRPMLVLGVGQHAKDGQDEIVDSVLKFILTRHANYRLGGNVTPPFLK